MRGSQESNLNILSDSGCQNTCTPVLLGHALDELLAISRQLQLPPGSSSVFLLAADSLSVNRHRAHEDCLRLANDHVVFHLGNGAVIAPGECGAHLGVRRLRTQSQCLEVQLLAAAVEAHMEQSWVRRQHINPPSLARTKTTKRRRPRLSDIGQAGGT